MRKLFQEFTGKKDYQEFTDRLVKTCEGYADIMQIGAVDEFQIFKVVINPDAKRTIVFLAGLHGDESAPVFGILKFLEAKPRISEDLRIVMIPLCNPVGFVKNKREGGDGKDMNRKFYNDDISGESKYLHDALKDEKVIFLCTLHEDPDLRDFYLYYTKHKELAEELRSLAKKHFSIHPDGELYQDKVHDGLIALPHTRRGGIEDLLMDKGVPYVTTETPGKALWKDRVEFNAKAIRLIIYAF
jgi:predicted deacylase